MSEIGQSITPEVDWTKDVDLTTRAKVTCPSCGVAADDGKFCGDCGAQLKVEGECAHCGTQLGSARFCSECGQKA